MKQMSWLRVRAAFINLGGVVIFRDSPYAVHMNRGPERVALLRKMSPVPVFEQRRLVALFGFTVEEYLVALAGSGPRIEDDGSK